MAPIEKTSISEQIVRALRRDILSGLLPPGSRLPAEAELAQRFGTNRNTLREAIRTLEGQHLLQVRQGDGVTVRDFRQAGEISLLPLFLADGGGIEERRTALEDLLVLRRLVLGEAAVLAARRAGPEEREALRARLLRVRECQGRTSELIVADLDFYRQLCNAAHSLIYIWLFNTFERSYRALLALVEQLWVVPNGYLERLQALVEAISEGDGQAARSLLVEHFDAGDALALSLTGASRDHTPARRASGEFALHRGASEGREQGELRGAAGVGEGPRGAAAQEQLREDAAPSEEEKR